MEFDRADNLPLPPYMEGVDNNPLPTTDMEDGYPTYDIMPPSEEPDILYEAAEQTASRTVPHKQCNYLDGHVVSGDHPDGQVQQFIEDGITRRAEEKREEVQFLDTTPHQLPECGPLHQKARDCLVTDFGPALADMPITALTPEGYREYIKKHAPELRPSNLGFYSSNRIAVIRREGYSDEVNEIINTGTLLHEGAHASQSDETYMITVVPLTERHQNVTDAERRIGHRVNGFRVGGFREYDPTVQIDSSIGGLIEEAFAECYSVRTKEKLGLAPTHTIPSCNQSQLRKVGLQHGLIFSDREADKVYDVAQDTVHMPWKYTKATYASKHPANPLIPLLTANTHLAYVIDLLDAHRPGLYDTMVASRQDAALKQDVKDAINSVQPGLYDRLSRLSTTPVNTEYALLTVIDALGLADRRIGDIFT